MYRMFIRSRAVILFGLFIFLTSCGGGSSNGTSETDLNPDSNTQNPAPANGPDAFNLDDAELFDQYTGLNSAALLDDNSYDKYIVLALSGTHLGSSYDSVATPQLRATSRVFKNISDGPSSSNRYLPNAIETLTQGACEANGQFLIRQGNDDGKTGEKELIFEQCDDGHVILNGTVSLFILDDNPVSYEYIAFFKKLHLTETGTSYNISGRQHSKTTLTDISETTSDLVVTNLINNKQTRFEKYITLTCNLCIGEFEERVDGRIYLSDDGYFDVTTSQALYNSRGTVSGYIELSDATGTALILDFRLIEVYRLSTVDVPFSYVQIKRTSEGATPEILASIPTYLFSQEQILDFQDNDKDGIPNGWELVFGLNPNDSADAEIDSDFDSFTNLDEYLGYGEPTSDNIVPIITDLSTTVILNEPITRAGTPVDIKIATSNPNPVFGSSQVNITLTKSPNIEWSNTSFCRPVTNNQNQLTCYLPYIPHDFTYALIVSVIGEPEEFSVVAEVESVTLDNNLSNNRNSVSDTFLPRESNIRLVSDEPFSYNPYYHTAVVAHTHVFDLSLQNLGPDVAYNAVFSMTLPVLATVNKAEVIDGDGATTAICSIDPVITCLIEQQHLYKDNIIRIEITGDIDGIDEYTASVSSDSVETEPSDNSITKSLFVGKSTQPIQQQIDTLSEPIVINLDTGMYAGSLDTKGKQVTLRGHLPVGSTVIRTDSPGSSSGFFELKSNSSVENIHFFGRKETTGTTANYSISTSGTNVVIQNNMFQSTSIAGSGDGATGSDLVTIRNNKLFNDCSSIVADINVSNRIENNIIYSTSCTGISVGGFQDPFSLAPATHIITNNTIASTPTAIDAHVMINDNYMTIQNNLITDNERGLIVHSDGVYEAFIQTGIFPVSTPDILNNLLYNNDTHFIANGVLNITPFIVGDNIEADPLFLDTGNLDFQLSPSSPAIDAGTGVLAPTIDFAYQTRPVDGDLNTIPDTDIGAFEYQP